MVYMRNDDEDQVKAKLDALEADSESDDNTSISSRVRNTGEAQLTGNGIKVQRKELLEDQADESDQSEHGGDLLKMLRELFPAEPDFSLSKYDTDPKYKENRDMDARDREISRYYQTGKYVGNAGRGPGYHVNPLTASAAAAVTIGAVGAVTIGERQREFYQNMDNVSKLTGAPVKLMGAMWGIESSFSKNQTSPSGCQGPAQFTRGTFAAMIRQYGDHIPGMEQYAVGLRNGTIKASDEGMQAMRNNQKVAGYAMGFYLQEIARDMKLDINDPQNWGKLYAAYNVGPGNAKILARNGDIDASVKNWNPAFYVNGATGFRALDHYQTAIANGISSFTMKIVAKMDPSAPEPTSVASAVSGPAIKSDAKAKAEFSDAKTDAKAKEAADAVVKTAENDVSKFQKFKTMLYGYVGLDDDAKPSPKLAAAKPKVELVPHIYG